MRGFPEYLRDQGWDVHVVSSPGPLLERLRLAEGISTHQLPMAREPSPFADITALVAWIRLLRKIRPMVTSVGTPKAGLLGGLAAKLTGVPHRVYLLRGLRLETSTGIKRRIFTLAEKVASSTAHRVVAVSASLRARAIELRVVHANKIIVIGSGSSNGVDTTAHSADVIDVEEKLALRTELKIDKEVPVIGFVGRLTTDKGLDVLAEARQLLADSDTDYYLLVIGGIDDGQNNSVVAQLTETGRPAIISGHVSDPRPYYSIMDVLCLPTFREGFPNVVLEAAAMGVPAVTTNATGAVDSVVDGLTGMVVEVKSGPALADALRLLVSDSTLRERLGAAARAHVVEHFERGSVWQANEQFYSSLAESSSDQ
ncbi:glycosyltransferase family 4 protein [Salinibacterium sp. M195]|uniref:glycosyltransferase family 4 protein n=1 Tax=Salinibacterium sp. M195 TaxID=2583374 RepID=UPI002107ABC1|nr:glycosyltransferase family 4 protein [Salinibacterium sp. M195]